ncbi:helix-turn-helix domain-containing protein [Candidatus Galacturonibacter soehngenii]|uniref:Helix-turn-helix transcriptional regulator n=1 Tax=Candidatus Galacturonatibacter soehngenii TaxID=2307010 RepID=A0A7V7QIL5_9FIRM|nr:helix-turn-helix transcriptional regulator [Candidatus Galacturonibacter soehngenii]KAB1436025.1 helix-turn-helix transcriptional regulator [Candidatus Galacturonibacter soehngenii]MBA4686237.1 helix-turn-helix transcriptional regulator [Candidatus Galacturonibacter soehngenii]
MKEPYEIIRGLREDKDLRQSDIAKIIGTTQQHYSRCEQGDSDLQTRAVIALANFYDVSTDYLLGRTACKGGIQSLNETVVGEYTSGQLITDVLSLNNSGRRAVLEYIELQKLKERVAHLGL